MLKRINWNCIGILVVGFLLVSGIPVNDKVPSGLSIASEMFERTKKINTMVFEMKKLERIRGEIIEQRSFVKLSRDPLKVYSRQLHPKEGLEILYVKGINNDQALINPNGFPWVNLKLDPYGSIMRKDQHHTIKDAGYDLVVSILEFLFHKYSDEISSMVQNKGLINWKGDSCWVVEMNNPYFEYIDYVVQEGENIITISEKFMLSEHMIVEHNEEVDDFYDVTAGQVIEIPNDYSPKIILYIDKDRMIPVLMQIYDDKGLYESYEYEKLSVDTDLSSDEFSPDYEEYDF